jgi:hypothetical protein
VDRDTKAMFQHKVAVLEEVVHRQATSQETESRESEVEGGQTTVRDSQLKSLYQSEKENRAELFGQSGGGTSSLRHRGCVCWEYIFQSTIMSLSLTHTGQDRQRQPLSITVGTRRVSQRR